MLFLAIPFVIEIDWTPWQHGVVEQQCPRYATSIIGWWPLSNRRISFEPGIVCQTQRHQIAGHWPINIGPFGSAAGFCTGKLASDEGRFQQIYECMQVEALFAIADFRMMPGCITRSLACQPTFSIMMKSRLDRTLKDF